jgi:hypothetical protein
MEKSKDKGPRAGATGIDAIGTGIRWMKRGSSARATDRAYTSYLSGTRNMDGAAKLAQPYCGSSC